MNANAIVVPTNSERRGEVPAPASNGSRITATLVFCVSCIAFIASLTLPAVTLLGPRGEREVQGFPVFLISLLIVPAMLAALPTMAISAIGRGHPVEIIVVLQTCLLCVANWILIVSPKLFQLARRGQVKRLWALVSCSAVVAWALPEMPALFVKGVLIGWYFWSAALSTLAIALFLAGRERRGSDISIPPRPLAVGFTEPLYK